MGDIAPPFLGLRSCMHDAIGTSFIRKNCEKFGKTNVAVKSYPGMGHAMDAPFAPVAITILHMLGPKGTRIYLGGADKMAASRSQLMCFHNIIQFFSSRLT